MKRTLLVVIVLGFACAARAQPAPLVDPTRPPIVEPERPADAGQKPAGPRLQSVLISPSRRVAVIDGNAVAVGEKFGEATVTAISEGAVVLRYADRKETLHLLPDVQRRAREERGAALKEEGNPR
ncbi:MAG: MSHA biogenesis protein MshK [Burkholderiales bacterium]